MFVLELAFHRNLAITQYHPSCPFSDSSIKGMPYVPVGPYCYMEMPFSVM